MNRFKKNKIAIILGFLCIPSLHAREYAQQPFYAAAEYLFWKPHVDQLTFGMDFPQGVPDGGLIGAPAIAATDQQFRSSSGGRVKAGFFFTDDWDVRFSFTKFNNHSATSLASPVFASPFFGFLDSFFANAVRSNWRLHYDTVAFELARDFCLCETFFIRPHIGLLWTRINQCQFINYLEGTRLDLKVAVTANVQRANNFKGIGPRLGIEGSYYFCNNLHFIGNVALAALYGKFNSQASYNLSFTPDNSGPQNFAPHIISCSKKRLRPTLQLIVGLGWDMVCCDNIFEIGAAYEANYWWNQWQVPGSLIAAASSNIASGDLMLHGLTMHVGFKF